MNKRKRLDFWLLLESGIALACLFHVGVYLPLMVAVALLAGLTLYGVFASDGPQLRLLPRLMVLLYSLPFSVTLMFLIDPEYNWYSELVYRNIPWDRLVDVEMLNLGLIGLLGLLSGIYAYEDHIKGRSHPRTTVSSVTPMSLGSFGVFLALALLLSWFSAPTETIFSAPYASVGSNYSTRLNFDAAFLVSYVIVTMLWIDAEREAVNSQRRRRKFLGIAFSVGVIVLYFQLARGDRESIGLVAALSLLYLTGPLYKPTSSNINRVIKRRMWRLIIPFALVIAVFILIGSIRFSMSTNSNLKLKDEFVSGMRQNTWTGILLTNLGLALEYRYGNIDYMYGRTYLDYLMSLPPGVVTRLVGVNRPLESDHNPNWWYPGIAGGGIHPVVVPFKNFGAFGVFFVLFLYGVFVSHIEMRNSTGSFKNRLMYGAVVSSSFTWFWYGDMNIIRGVMAAAILAWVYRLFVKRIDSANRLPVGESTYYEHNGPGANLAGMPLMPPMASAENIGAMVEATSGRGLTDFELVEMDFLTYCELTEMNF